VDRDATGYVVQDADAPRGNVRTVVVGGTAAGDDEAWRALEVVGLSDAIRRLPMGLSTVVTDGSGGFSATQIQLMQLARALARRPRLLLLDEPPVAVAGALRSRDGVTRVVVTCSPSLLDAADRVITLGEGAPTNTETRWGKS
jgi:ABC-type multidrug transport system fused ATPase/permease subunit